MRTLAKLWTAFATLAESVLSLSRVLDAATDRLRHQLDFEEAAPGKRNGRAPAPA